MRYLKLKYLFIYLIKLYKVTFSSVLPPSCRHYPTCSEYAIEALDKYGFFKGGFISVVRILKCNPFFKGGYDPVP